LAGACQLSSLFVTLMQQPAPLAVAVNPPVCQGHAVGIFMMHDVGGYARGADDSGSIAQYSGWCAIYAEAIVVMLSAPLASLPSCLATRLQSRCVIINY
jgi:hypothetical protein